MASLTSTSQRSGPGGQIDDEPVPSTPSGGDVGSMLLWWAGLVGTLLLWQGFAAVANNSLIVGPIAVAAAAAELTASGELLEFARSSAFTFAIGFSSGCLAGLLVGILVGRFGLVDTVLTPYIAALYAMPLVAVVPVLIVVLGFGLLAKTVIIGLFAFFPVAINTSAGVKNVSGDLTELARSFCSSELRTWRDIVVPASLPFIVAGLRLAVGRSLIGVVISEFETSVTGLGYMILFYSRRFEMAKSLVPVVLLMLVGFLLYAGLQAIERRLAAWRQ